MAEGVHQWETEDAAVQVSMAGIAVDENAISEFQNMKSKSVVSFPLPEVWDIREEAQSERCGDDVTMYTKAHGAYRNLASCNDEWFRVFERKLGVLVNQNTGFCSCLYSPRRIDCQAVLASIQSCGLDCQLWGTMPSIM